MKQIARNHCSSHIQVSRALRTGYCQRLTQKTSTLVSNDGENVSLGTWCLYKEGNKKAMIDMSQDIRMQGDKIKPGEVHYYFSIERWYPRFLRVGVAQL